MSEEKKKYDKVSYNREFNEKNYDRIAVLVPKGKREKYKEHANSHGYNSLNDFAVKSMENQIRIDLTDISEG